MTELPEKEFDDLYTKVHKRFETIRADVYYKIMDEEIESQLAREYMQKAYVTFSTISSSSKIEGGEVKKARWATLVQQVAIEHGKFIGQMAEGKFYDNIDKDPLDNIYADEKVDLKSLKQYKPGL